MEGKEKKIVEEQVEEEQPIAATEEQPVDNDDTNQNGGEIGDTPAPMAEEVGEGDTEDAEGLGNEESAEMDEPQPQEEIGMDEPQPQEPEQPVEKMLTQSQVNELVGRARMEGRDSAMKDLYGRYGVSGDDELNGIFGKGQAYEGLNDEYLGQQELYKQVMAENALLKSRVEPSRWDDIKLILGGKGLDISQENIESMIPSHPEWRGQIIDSAQQEQQPMAGGKVLTPDMAKQFAENPNPGTLGGGQQQPATLRKFGNEATPIAEIGETEEDRARKLYGF